MPPKGRRLTSEKYIEGIRLISEYTKPDGTLTLNELLNTDNRRKYFGSAQVIRMFLNLFEENQTKKVETDNGIKNLYTKKELHKMLTAIKKANPPLPERYTLDQLKEGPFSEKVYTATKLRISRERKEETGATGVEVVSEGESEESTKYEEGEAEESEIELSSIIKKNK